MSPRLQLRLPNMDGMERPQWLTEDLRAAPFALRDAEAVGLSRSRQDAPALQRPFKGVRSTRAPESAIDRARDYEPRLKARQVFAGVTALRLHGLPWRVPWCPEEIVELAVPGQDYAPRSAGVRGQRLAEHRFRTTAVDGLPVLQPMAAVMTVAERLPFEDLVALLDAMVTPSLRYPGLRHRPLSSSVSQLRLEAEAWGPSPARKRVLAALQEVRPGVDSYPESVTRIVFVRAGLPEPEIQVPIQTPRGLRHADGGWPEFKVCFEYEGDHHRTDAAQWEHDIIARRGLRVRRLDPPPGHEVEPAPARTPGADRPSAPCSHRTGMARHR